MRACIVRPHHAGLFSLINNVVTCLSLYDYVHVDWSEGCIYGDAWPHLFYANRHPSEVPDVTSIDVVSNYPHQALTYRNAGILYPADALIGWRGSCNRLWERLNVRNEIWEQAEEFIEHYLGRGEYTSVLVRGSGHAGEQLHGKAQTREDYRRAIKQARGAIFIAAADTESLSWFDDIQCVYYSRTRRSSSRDIQPHLETPQTIEDAINCFVEVLIMASGESLIHPVSNMATAALYVNPEMKSVFLA